MSLELGGGQSKECLGQSWKDSKNSEMLLEWKTGHPLTDIDLI